MSARPTWDDTWMAVADVLARRSLCERAQVGAVIVGADNQVISATYNGPPPGLPVTGLCGVWCERSQSGDTAPSYDSCPSNHAEANAIARSDWSRMYGGTIYVTTFVCMNCAKLIAATGISRVVHRYDPDALYRNPADVALFLVRNGIHVEAV